MSATHAQIEERAYYLWERRGRPVGSPEVDWERAERELREQEAEQTAGWPRPVRPVRARRPRAKRTDAT